ncbi:MAG: hypothetical protein IKW74_08025, partial [Thermoguttaceae bacterium]|nr:hypothetical protein [Thermoguttaceae bacterium]
NAEFELFSDNPLMCCDILKYHFIGNMLALWYNNTITPHERIGISHYFSGAAMVPTFTHRFPAGHKFLTQNDSIFHFKSNGKTV